MLLLTAELMPHPVADWTLDGDWSLSEARQYTEGGSRVAVLLSAEVSDPVWVEIRSIDEAGFPGPWLATTEVWRGGDSQRVLTADLSDWSPGAQLRVHGAVDAVSWGLHVVEPRGVATAPPPPLSASLTDIGVISRQDWGAEATTCTTTEDDWYRFAIHHTAGNQTGGGTVQGAVQALQAYAMGSGSYCDIPYQFLVGYDGSLWEGRPLALYSGATGGGNNDGNIAISYLGCYDTGGCGDGGDELPLIMHASARLLAQTLATEHDIITSADTLKGHRDWPDNATACPGDRVHDRITELMSAEAHYEGVLVASGWEEPITVPLGQTAQGWLRLQNTGIEPWGESTWLAPLPRDVAHVLADESWESESRIAATGSVAPGEVVEIPISLYGAALGTTTLELTLVEEWVTWFPDAPIGGGPQALSFTVEVVEDQGEPGDSGASDTGGSEPGPAPAFVGPPGEAVALHRGCASAPRPAPAPLLAAVALLLLGRVRASPGSLETSDAALAQRPHSRNRAR